MRRGETGGGWSVRPTHTRYRSAGQPVGRADLRGNRDSLRRVAGQRRGEERTHSHARRSEMRRDRKKHLGINRWRVPLPVPAPASATGGFTSNTPAVTHAPRTHKEIHFFASLKIHEFSSFTLRRLPALVNKRFEPTHRQLDTSAPRFCTLSRRPLRDTSTIVRRIVLDDNRAARLDCVTVLTSWS